MIYGIFVNLRVLGSLGAAEDDGTSFRRARLMLALGAAGSPNLNHRGFQKLGCC